MTKKVDCWERFKTPIIHSVFVRAIESMTILFVRLFPSVYMDTTDKCLFV